MKTYVRREASTLLRRLAAQIREAQLRDNEESVHNLRTGIRRLSECLRTFDMFFPKGEAARLRRELKQMMALAGEVRNRDVAGKLFAHAGMAPGRKLMVELEEQHRHARAALADRLRASRDLPLRCRRGLQL